MVVQKEENISCAILHFLVLSHYCSVALRGYSLPLQIRVCGKLFDINDGFLGLRELKETKETIPNYTPVAFLRA